MAIKPTNNQECLVNYSNRDLTQCGGVWNNFSLLTLPYDVFKRIVLELCNEPSPMRGAIHAVNFGRVSLLTHKRTHEESEIDALIHNEEKFKPFIDILKGDPTVDSDDRERMELLTLFEVKDSVSARRLIISRIYDIEMGLPVSLEKDNIEKYVSVVDGDVIPEELIDYYMNKNSRELFSIYKAIFIRAMRSYNLKPDTKKYIQYAHHAAAVINYNSQFGEEFYKRIFDIVIDYNARMPFSAFTVNRYNACVDALSDLLPEMPQQEREKELRQAVCKFHDKKEFDGVIEKYSNPPETLVTGYTDSFRRKRSHALEKVAQELEVFRQGDNVIVIESDRLGHAEKVSALYKAVYIACLKAHTEKCGSSCQIEEVAESKKVVDRAFDDYLNADHAHKEAKKQFESLNATILALDGKKAELEASLQDKKLTEDVRKALKKVSDFYTQLSCPINEDNKDVLFDELHKILGQLQGNLT